MFRKAYELAIQFTAPMILSRRSVSGKCASAIGACVIVNEEGWIVTAGHMMEQWLQLQTETKKAMELEAERARIDSDTSLDRKAKRKALAKAYPPDGSTCRCSMLIGGLPGNVQPAIWHIVPAVDLAVARA